MDLSKEQQLNRDSRPKGKQRSAGRQAGQPGEKGRPRETTLRGAGTEKPTHHDRQGRVATMTKNELDHEKVSALTAAEMRQLDSLVFWGMRWEQAMAEGRKTWSPVMGPLPERYGR